MRNHCILFLLVLIATFCSEQHTPENDVINEYRYKIKSTEDSLSIALADTLSYNPILKKLEVNQGWYSEQNEWGRNPFKKKVAEPRPKPKFTAPPVPRVEINEIEGLSLNGIIQVGIVYKALINGQLYEVGDSIRNLRIIEIDKKRVVLKSLRKVYSLNL